MDIKVTDEMIQVARSMKSFESMIERIIELHEQSKWKDVEKSLPTKTDNYLTDVGLVHFDSDEKVWCVFNTNGYPDYDVDVVCWQPLPTFKE